MRARLKDVAAKAGVAPNTASMILNRRPGSWASDATKRRVFDAAKELGYRPSRAALGIRTGRFKAIGVVLPDLNPLYIHFIDCLERFLRARDYFLVIENGRADVAFEAACLDSILDRQIDGLCYFMGDPVAHESYSKKAESRGKCVVAIGGPSPEPFSFDAVLTDFNVAISQAVDHLADLGHRHFVFLCALAKGREAGDRPTLFKDLLGRHGIAPEAVEVVSCGHELMDARDAFGAFLDQRKSPRPTALFALNDTAAIGAIRAATERGLRVPEDLSVIGVDNIPVGECLPRSLTTIAQPVEEMAEAAADLLIRRLEAGEDVAPESRYFASRFLVKETTAPPPPGAAGVPS